MEHIKIIQALGGYEGLAKKLAMPSSSVRAWKARGFPAWFRADHPDLIRKGKRLAGIK